MLELCLNELALAVVCHVLDKLSDPAMEVFLSGNELAVYQLLVRDLHLFITSINGGLFVGEAAFGFLLGHQSDKNGGVVHNVGIVVFVKVSKQALGCPDLIRMHACCAFK